MAKKLLKLFLIILITPSQLFSQIKDIVVRSEQNDDRSVTFYYEKNVPGSHFLSLKFENIINADEKEFRETITSKSGELFTLKPIIAEKGISYSYNYWFIMGDFKPEFDSSFVYLLPISNQKESRITQLTNLDELYFGGKKPFNWTALLFETEIGDTIYAARKGTVIKIVDGFNYDSLNLVSYQSNVNELIVEHEDGTIATYSCFEKNSIMVELEQTVYPLTPLGVVAQYDKRKKGQLRFYVNYLNNTTWEKNKVETLFNKINRYAYLNPLFLTETGIEKLKPGNTYKAKTTNEILRKEFTRRELKKYSK